MMKYGLAVMLLLGALVCHADEVTPTREYQIKASLLFNVLQYIEWPADSEFARQEKVLLCVVGQEKFGVALKVLEQGTTHGKPIQVYRASNPGPTELIKCSIVFVSAGYEPEGIIQAVHGRHVLTVGETSDFLRRGGAISLLLERDKIVFEVNRRAIEAEGLEPSSKLLRMARTAIE